MKKHTDLLISIPNEYFGTTQRYIKNIRDSVKENGTVTKLDIIGCYYALANSLCEDKFSSYAIKNKTKSVKEEDLCYKFLDYINPRRNHIYGYVYKNNFMLPKMYKNALVNKRNSYVVVKVTPKQGQSFNEANKLRKQFVCAATLAHNNYLCGNNFDTCLEQSYNALKNLVSKNLIGLNERHNKVTGSTILTQELINLLYNQRIILEGHYLLRFAESTEERQKIMADIIAHKKAMFGELQRQFTV